MTEEDKPKETPPAPLDKALAWLEGVIEPRVLHGYTLTKDVLFRDVCQTIRDDAFTVTDRPLIVSLEVHCCPEQQETMVKIMQNMWQEYLLPPPEKEAPALPSPDELRRKILIKVKYAPEPENEEDANKPSGPAEEGGDDDDESEGERLLPADEKRAEEQKKKGRDGKDKEDKKKATKQKKKKKPSKVIPMLSRLGIYTRSVHFSGFAQPEAAWPNHIFSLSEKGVLERHGEEVEALFRHNEHFLMRAYPSGFRISSSNLDPAVFWRKGIQIVALNWQSWDEGMMLNEGMFAGTGGYVLKPEGKPT